MIRWLFKHGLRLTRITIMCCLPAHAFADQTVTVIITGSGTGLILANVFSDPADTTEHFMKNKAQFSFRGQSKIDGAFTFSFSAETGVRYAVAAFQDENGDGILNSNVVGMPTENYGFSNDARGLFGPPDFDDAAFLSDSPMASPVTFALK